MSDNINPSFFNMINNFNLVPIIIAGITSNVLNPIIKSMINDVILPLLLFDLNNDGVPDLHKYKNKKFRFYGVVIRYGLLFYNILEALLTILFFIMIQKIFLTCSRVYKTYLIIH